MKIGIIGYGKMGKGIFNLFSSLNFEVTVLIRENDKAINFQVQVDRRLRRALKKGLINEDQFQKKSTTLLFSQNLEDLGNCDLVIETITEDAKEKVTLFQKLGPLLSPRAIMVTNTSSLSINELAGKIKNNERFCGFHFFNPIPLVNIVEIIKWKNVSNETVNFLSDLAYRIGRKAIIVNDACGSGINDVLMYYYAEGIYLLEQGFATPSQIDKAAKAFNTFGPCESIDIIGIPLTAKIMENKFKRSKEGLVRSSLLYSLISQNRLGKDCGKGLYTYSGETLEEDTPEFYIHEGQKHSRPDSINNEAFILNRLFYSILNGFFYNLSKGTCSQENLDRGIKEVLGMPKGPLALIESIGKDKMREELDSLADHVGVRFRQTYN